MLKETNTVTKLELPGVPAETTIEDAVKMMEEKRLLNLPVTKNGRVPYSVTRHDLLRAGIGGFASGKRNMTHERDKTQEGSLPA